MSEDQSTETVSAAESDEEAETKKAVTLKEFLESHPPSKIVEIDQLVHWKSPYSGGPLEARLNEVELELYCDHEKCKGKRIFRKTTGTVEVATSNYTSTFVTFLCSNCREKTKEYSLAIKAEGQPEEAHGWIYKFGELPQFGPRFNRKLYDLVGSDKDLLFKGLECESSGLGIGAFSYYRRVIENQRDRLFDQIIKVASKLELDKEFIEDVAAAKAEKSFSQSLKKITHSIPDILKIDGQNPLTLLHDALSVGLHDQNDPECLQAAGDIRMVLGAMAERMAQVVVENKELESAVKRLVQNRSKK